MANSRLRSLSSTIILAVCMIGGSPTTKPAASPTTNAASSTTRAAASPTTKPAGSLLGVEAAFSSRKRTLDEQYQRDVYAAEAERLKGLKTLLDRAMEKKDLEAVIQLREKIEASEAELKSAKPLPERSTDLEEISKLQKTLRGTVWEWGGPEEAIRFEENGTIGKADWSSWGLVTTWKVIDRRTVLLHIQQGRNDNRYAVLTFNPEADSFDIYDFGGKEVTLRNRIKK